MVNQTILDLLNILLLYEKIIIITCSSTRHYKNSSCSVAVMSKFFSPMDWRISGFPVVHHFPEITKLMSIESVMPSNHFILCRPLLLLPSIFPRIKVFSNDQLFTSGGQCIGVSASTSILPMNTQDWSPLGWTGWISLQSKGLSRVFSNTTVQKHQFFSTQPSLWSNSHIHTWPLEKPWLWLDGPLLAK